MDYQIKEISIVNLALIPVLSGSEFATTVVPPGAKGSLADAGPSL